MAIVYARRGCVVTWSGGRTILTQDQPWDAEAALVKARPELFQDEPVTLHGRPPQSAAAEPETAAQAPGEKRRTRARRR
ncbi:hypothetical protein [Streptomyces carpaticus]|uniref:hypothetical protein n=1 Tax=Streptomyces carpaticus TaxID=285558 RepID=UPI0031F87F74